MVYSNKIKPTPELPEQSFSNPQSSADFLGGVRRDSVASSKEFSDLDSISTVQLEESSFLKLKPFTRLDPTLERLIGVMQCFGLFLNSDLAVKKGKSGSGKFIRSIRVIATLTVAIITSEVVYDVNLRQSKLLAEQKRSTPLLTFVIVAYSWLTLIIPLICDLCLILIGPYLFRFYSRTTATVCDGAYFGRKTSVDSWVYYLTLSLTGFLDVIGQVMLLGVWPSFIDSYMSVFTAQDKRFDPVEANRASDVANQTLSLSAAVQGNSSLGGMGSATMSAFSEGDRDKPMVEAAGSNPSGPRINAYLLDTILGETHAHSDLGVSIKIICLVIQLAHGCTFLAIIVSFADHHASVINSINDQLAKYEFRRLLKQLIILRDSSEQISLMISIPFSLIILLAFMRQIALNGVFIQSTMQPYENLAVSLQSFTCSLCIFIVFIYCDGLQSASKQTHRLKTEQTVINENRGGNQSIYEFLDYLDRLSKSIRITFFNIITINKGSLVGLYGHILTLTFVTS